MNANTSPSGAPFWRRRTASSNCARSFSSIFARSPPAKAGDNRKMRDVGEPEGKHPFSRTTAQGRECAIILKMPTDYDLVAIGGGAAGLVAAGMSALLGAKTALVEQHRL